MSDSDQRAARRLLWRLRYALILLMFGVCTTVLTTAVVTNEAEKRLVQEIGQNLNGQASLLAITLDRMIYGRWRDIATAAKVDAAVWTRGTRNEQKAALERLMAGTIEFAWIGFADREGIVQAASADMLLGVNVSARPWFAQGLKSVYAGDVHEAVLLSEKLVNETTEPLRFFDIAAPVLDSEGATLGVLAAHLYWGWGTETAHLLKQAIASVTSSADVVIVSDDGTVVLGPEGLMGRQLTDSARSPGSLSPDLLVGRALTPGYRDYRGVGWTVLVRQDLVKALSPATTLKRNILSWGIASSLALAAAVALASAAVAYPVNALSQSALTLTAEKQELTTQLEQTANTSPGVICSIKMTAGGSTSFTYASAKLRDVFGVAPPGMMGSTEPVMSRISAEDLPGVTETLQASAADLSPWRSEFRYHHPDKGLVWIEANLTPLREAGGSIVWHGFAQDVTRRKQSETALANYSRLDAAGQLAAAAAHDFNNLLTVISGNLELAELRFQDQDARTWIRRAIDAAESGASHNRRLLALVQNRQLELRSVDVNSVALEAVRLLERTLGHNASLTCDLVADAWTVRADRGELFSALLNLALNARDAISESGALKFETANIHLDGAQAAQLSADAKPGDYVRICVKDNGTGMTADVLARAAEPLFTTKGPGRGTGLGLSSVVAFARQADGFTTIESELAKGTTVSIYLPRSIV